MSWPARRTASIICALQLVCGAAYGQLQNPAVSEAWWVWAGISLHEVPADAPIYLYQGRFKYSKGRESFLPRGYFPHPIERGDISLVFRLEQLPPVKYVLQVINGRVRDWQRYAVAITEVQLDFDSPTARLEEYASYLARIRQGLDTAQRLSITGLGTWLLDAETKTLTALYRSVDHIVFQLYTGRKAIANIGWYLTRLRRLEQPYRIGLLPKMRRERERVLASGLPGLQGLVYFYQRGG